MEEISTSSLSLFPLPSSLTIIHLFLNRNYGTYFRRYLNCVDKAIFILAFIDDKNHASSLIDDTTTSKSLKWLVIDWLKSNNAYPMPKYNDKEIIVSDPLAGYLIRNNYLTLLHYLININITILRKDDVKLLHIAIKSAKKNTDSSNDNNNSNVDAIHLLWSYGIHCDHKNNTETMSSKGDPCIYYALSVGNTELARRLSWHGMKYKSSCQDLVYHEDRKTYDAIKSRIVASVTKENFFKGYNYDELVQRGVLLDRPYQNMPWITIESKLRGWVMTGNITKLDKFHYKAQVERFLGNDLRMRKLQSIYFHSAAHRGHLNIFEWGVKVELLTSTKDYRTILSTAVRHGHFHIFNFITSPTNGLMLHFSDNSRQETINTWRDILDNAIDRGNFKTYCWARDEIFARYRVARITNVHDGTGTFTQETVNGNDNSKPVFTCCPWLLDSATTTNSKEIAENIQLLFCTNDFDNTYDNCSVSMIQWIHDNMFPVSNFQYESVVYIKNHRQRFRYAKEIFRLGGTLSPESLNTILKHGDVEMLQWLDEHQLLTPEMLMQVELPIKNQEKMSGVFELMRCKYCWELLK